MPKPTFLLKVGKIYVTSIAGIGRRIGSSEIEMRRRLVAGGEMNGQTRWKLQLNFGNVTSRRKAPFEGCNSNLARPMGPMEV
jgi:hypothetical protein